MATNKSKAHKSAAPTTAPTAPTAPTTAPTAQAVTTGATPKPLTPTQVRMLQCIANGVTTRKAMANTQGMPQKGYSKALGAPSKGALGAFTLGGRGMVTHQYQNGVLVYQLTPAGKAALPSA